MHIYINMLHTYTDEQIIYEYKCIYIHINTYIDIYIYKYMYTQTRGGDGGMHAAQHATHVSGCCDSYHRTCNLHVRVTVGVAVCCSVLRFGAVYCSVLQCVATLYTIRHIRLLCSRHGAFLSEWVCVCVCVCACVCVCGCLDVLVTAQCHTSTTSHLQRARHIYYIWAYEHIIFIMHLQRTCSLQMYETCDMLSTNVWWMWYVLCKCRTHMICSLRM